MELESLADGEFMRTTGERKKKTKKTIKAIWKCYFWEEMVVNLHLLARQTVSWSWLARLKKENSSLAALMHFYRCYMEGDHSVCKKNTGSLISYQHFLMFVCSLVSTLRERVRKRGASDTILMFWEMRKTPPPSRSPEENSLLHVSGTEKSFFLGGSAPSAPRYPFYICLFFILSSSLCLCALTVNRTKGQSRGVNMLQPFDLTGLPLDH